MSSAEFTVASGRGCGGSPSVLAKSPFQGELTTQPFKAPLPDHPAYTHRGRSGFCRCSFIFHKEKLAVPLCVPYKDKTLFLLLHMLCERVCGLLLSVPLKVDEWQPSY